MLYFTANKLTIKPCLKHLANELHVFGCWQKFYPNPSINCENGILTIVGIAETATESIPESR